ncbi:ExbD/TolR family protein [Pannonibacter sp.]|uniref:ExbD/TolR family protein n=1 Tax=Pannonibacter sp. TaxID=1906786 RepID=UPI003F713022
MIRLNRDKPMRKMETTISLINIVFLMLIFFLVAGQIAPPLDSAVTLTDARDAESLPPPDALFAHADGRLTFRGADMTADAFVADRRMRLATDAPEILLAADRELDARRLVEVVDALKQAGAARVKVVTRRTTP